MEVSEIEERKHISKLEQEYSEAILEKKIELHHKGKRFYTCSIGGYQLIIIGTTDGRWIHTFIPCLTYINEVTKD